MSSPIRLPYRHSTAVSDYGWWNSVSDETTVRELRAKIAERVATKGKRKTKKQWKAPVPNDFGHGVVLAFDQTLTKTGFSMVVKNYRGLRITEGNVLVPEIFDDLSGFEETFAKAESLGALLTSTMMMFGVGVDAIVHEMPSVAGWRIESSLMAAREVRRAASIYARGVPVVMISNQSMRAMLNPPGERDEKRFVKRAVEALIPDYMRVTKRWNQDVHDSVGLALAYLHKEASWRG